ncbi:MAG: TonB-dependent receptor [Desulforegulaceae bacterium]|nr:TonB-dependent receptor [Desulforegulaceae bacterium]
MNAKVGYEFKNIDVYVYGKNIFDENHDSEGYFINYTIYEDPREVGVNLAYRF